MSNSNNHKPQNKDEFFDWLDKLSNQNDGAFENSAFTGDDFDKEAMQGFLSVDDTEKLKDLDAKINQQISEKINQKPNHQSQTKRIVWFSAAASLLLIIGIAVLFSHKAKNELSNEIAQSKIVVEEYENEQPITQKLTDSNQIAINTKDLSKTKQAKKATTTVTQNDDKPLKLLENKQQLEKNSEKSIESTNALSKDELADVDAVAVMSNNNETVFSAATAGVENDKSKKDYRSATQLVTAEETRTTESTLKKASSKVSSSNNAIKSDNEIAKNSSQTDFYLGGITQLQLDISKQIKINIDSIKITGKVKPNLTFELIAITTFPESSKEFKNEIVMFLKSSSKWQYDPKNTVVKKPYFILKFNK